MSSIEVLWTPDWHQALFECIKAAKKEVFLVSPWLKLQGAELILNALQENKSAPKVNLLTTFNESELIGAKSSSDLKAYCLLLGYGVEIRVVRGLHAKIYICDRQDIIVSSGNLTGPGLGLKPRCNLEIALHISDPNTAQEILKQVLEIWETSEILNLELLLKNVKRIQADNTDYIKSLQETSSNEEKGPKLEPHRSWWSETSSNKSSSDGPVKFDLSITELSNLRPDLKEVLDVCDTIQKQFKPQKKQKTVSGREPTKSQEKTSGTSSNELSPVLSQENSSESDDSVVSSVNESVISIATSTTEFETVTVNAQGEKIKPERCQAEVFVENLGEGVELEMVSIPGGSFMMGSPESEEGRYEDESPQHQVSVPPFFLGKYPVTQQQYETVMGNNPSRFKGANRPVEWVSWNDATEFCRQLSRKTGRQYRLPSEAQWEYTCRAGTTTPFYFGETITTDLANYNGNHTYGSGPKGIYREQTTDVGRFPPNAFGLYDMHGNVWEWCQDIWHDNYSGAPTDGSAWESGGDSSLRMLRGVSWYNLPRNCRCANRNRDYEGSINSGFRVVLMPGA